MAEPERDEARIAVLRETLRLYAETARAQDEADSDEERDRVGRDVEAVRELALAVAPADPPDSES